MKDDTTPGLTTARVEQYRPGILNLANQLTLLRILFVPVFVILIVYGELSWALAVFMAAAISDGLDGLIARQFGQKTSAGAILDPIADKLLMSCSIVLLALPQMNWVNPIPIWLMLLVIFRDAFILLGSLAFVLTYGFRVFPPSWTGKLSTMVQLVTIFAVLVFNWAGVEQPALRFLFILTGLLTVSSGVQYLYIVRRKVEG
jgi:cardiolipin synthase